MKKSSISVSEKKMVREYVFNEFTITNALIANLLGVIVIYFSLFMLNAVIFNSFDLIPQISFKEFVSQRFEYYVSTDSVELPETDLVGYLIGKFVIIFIQIILDALKYILFDVKKTEVFTVGTIIFITNILILSFIYLILYRNQIKTKVFIISLIIGIAISCILLNLIAFLIIGLSISPILLLYLDWWIFLPTTTISIPILAEWIIGIDGIWIIFFYIFVFFLSSIVSICCFLGSKFTRQKLPGATVTKLNKIQEKDDKWLWFLISSVVITIISTLWKFFGRIIVEFFAAYKPEDELEVNEFSIENTLFGVKLNVLTAEQVFIVYFILITIGYALGFMIAYDIYRRASGQKNWLELYKIRHPSKKEQIARWLTYTTLMSIYWMYSIYLPRYLLNDWMQTILFSFLITSISIAVGKLAMIEN